MSHTIDDRSSLHLSREEASELRWIYAAVFALFLAAALVARLLGWRWAPWPPGPNGYRSVMQEAREATNTYVPFAFMG